MEHERNCGGCTLCCKTHGIREFLKPAGVWCAFCAVGQGCAIYASRPQSCQEFTCAWLAGYGLDEHRPDKIGIVPEFRELQGLGVILCLWADAGTEAFNVSFVKRQTKLNLQAGKAVMHIPLNGDPKLYLPKGLKRSEYAYRFGHITTRDVETVPYRKGRF